MNDRSVTWHPSPLERAARWRALGYRGATLWLTGLSGAGKSTIAIEVERRLIEAGVPAYRLDGDNLRLGLNRDLRFSPKDRAENQRRVAEVAALLADAGCIAIASTISPLRAHRVAARKRHEELNLDFFEVFVSTPVDVCRARDPKGLYAKADRGELPSFTGVSAPYEPPEQPDLVVAAHELTIEEAAQVCLRFMVNLSLASSKIIESCPPPRTRD